LKGFEILNANLILKVLGW